MERSALASPNHFIANIAIFDVEEDKDMAGGIPPRVGYIDEGCLEQFQTEAVSAHFPDPIYDLAGSGADGRAL